MSNNKYKINLVKAVSIKIEVTPVIKVSVNVLGKKKPHQLSLFDEVKDKNI